jgi:hypothetical protein
LELPLRNFAAVQSNDVPNIAGTPAGGVLALNSAPAFKRANAATDKALQILWAASSSVEITQGFVTPPDMDLSKNFNVSLLAAMAGLTDTPTVAIDVFGATGDTNRGGNTPALGLAPLTPPPVPVSITVTPGNSTTPNFFSISITPGAHTTDALSLYGAYITYSRKP